MNASVRKITICEQNYKGFLKLIVRKKHLYKKDGLSIIYEMYVCLLLFLLWICRIQQRSMEENDAYYVYEVERTVHKEKTC